MNISACTPYTWNGAVTAKSNVMQRSKAHSVCSFRILRFQGHENVAGTVENTAGAPCGRYAELPSPPATVEPERGSSIDSGRH